MDRAEITPAPRWRSRAAGLFDAAVLGGVAWASRGRLQSARGRATLSLLMSGAESAREQLGSPGQRLLGVRTVDRRTGARVALWRTALLLGAGAAGQMLTRRLQPAPGFERDREDFLTEINDIHRRHPHDSPERDAERQALYRRHQVPVEPRQLLRAVGAGVAVSALNRRLRRRLAPTVEIRVRGRRDHSP